MTRCSRGYRQRDARPHRHRPLDAPDPRAAALEAARDAAAGLDGARCDLAVVFASGAHLAAPEATLEAVHEALAPEELVGCGAGGVIGARREVEDGHGGVGVGGQPRRRRGDDVPRHRRGARRGQRRARRHARPRRRRRRDPARRSVDASPPTPCCASSGDRPPMVPVLGGLASGADDGRRRRRCSSATEVVEEGAVGVRLDGVEVLPCVSQGAAPIGPELTITAGRAATSSASSPGGRRSRSCARRSRRSPPEDLELVQGGLLMGIVVDGNKPDYVQGDFLVRGLVGADPATGRSRSPPTSIRARSCGCTPATPPAPTATCARRSASRMRALGGRPPAGALVFSCNGRGRGMFGARRPRRRGGRRGARRRAGRGLLRGGRDRPGRRRASSCTASRPRWPCSLMHPRATGGCDGHESRGRTVLVTGATGGLGQAIARGARRARGATLVADRPARRRARAARRRARRPGASRATSPTAPRSTRLLAEAGEVDVLVANAGAAGQRRARTRSASRRSTARSTSTCARRCVLARRADRGDGRARRAATSCSSPRSAARPAPRHVGLLGHEVRPARLRARRCARTCAARRRRVRGLPRLHPRRRHVPESGAKLPPFVGTKRPEDVAARRGRRDRARPRRGRRRPAAGCGSARRSRASRPRPRRRAAQARRRRARRAGQTASATSV